jgi:hypothetical protein
VKDDRCRRVVALQFHGFIITISGIIFTIFIKHPDPGRPAHALRNFRVNWTEEAVITATKIHFSQVLVKRIVWDFLESEFLKFSPILSNCRIQLRGGRNETMPDFRFEPEIADQVNRKRRCLIRTVLGGQTQGPEFVHDVDHLSLVLPERDDVAPARAVRKFDGDHEGIMASLRFQAGHVEKQVPRFQDLRHRHVEPGVKDAAVADELVRTLA